jgi:heptosyltransferase-3
MKIKQALFLKTKNIGDSIILTSAISALPKDYRYVDVVCLPESESIFKMHPRVRYVFVIPRYLNGIYKVMAYIRFYKAIASQSYDLLAHFSNDWRGAVLARFPNINLSVSRRTARRGSFWHQSFDVLAPILDNERPMVEQDIDLLRSVNLYQKFEAPAYNLEINTAQKNKLSLWLRDHKVNLDSKLVVIHASARWKFKEIPETSWVRIVDELISKKINVVLSGSKDDLKTNELIFNLCHSKPLLTKNFTLADTAALYERADLILTIDSMSTHLACAVKTPVVSIFGPTNEKNWGPWKIKSKVITISTKNDMMFACRPCGQDGCEGSKISQCLVQLDPKVILREAYNFLKF